MSQKQKERVIDLELARVYIGPQVVTVRAGERGSSAVLRNLDESDGNALRRALPMFSNRRLKKELSRLADSFDGLKAMPSEPRNIAQQWQDPWGRLGASPGSFR